MCMDRYEIESALETMSKAQGFYQRILSGIRYGSDPERCWQVLEQQNFNDMLDIINFFEE